MPPINCRSISLVAILNLCYTDRERNAVPGFGNTVFNFTRVKVCKTVTECALLRFESQ
jgi:hypothetical protein